MTRKPTKEQLAYDNGYDVGLERGKTMGALAERKLMTEEYIALKKLADVGALRALTEMAQANAQLSESLYRAVGKVGM